LGRLERDRLADILRQAERAGIRGSIPEMLRDPRLVNILAGHFKAPPPTTEACLRYYRDHREELREPDLYVGRQIVLPLGAAAPAGEAWARAERIIAILNFAPHMFQDLLVSYGAKSAGGGPVRIGPVARGALPPPLDAMFFALRPGEIGPVPVLTERGAHVVILDRILGGEVPSFSSIAGRIRFLLRQELGRNAAARHLARLAERCGTAAPSLDRTDSAEAQA
jgi:peptidyl-prolyl cis-trans isomerase C